MHYVQLITGLIFRSTTKPVSGSRNQGEVIITHDGMYIPHAAKDFEYTSEDVVAKWEE